MRHAALALAVLVAQQTAAPKLSFEVATIKRNTAVDPGFALGFQPGGRFHAVGMDVRTLIAIAYQPPRLLPSQIIGGPDWTHTDGYDIVAKVGDNFAGGTPALAMPRTRARGLTPSHSAAASVARMSATAPSLTPDALPAVTVPGLRTIGLNFARPSSVVSGRGCSSFSTLTGPAFPPGTEIEMISSAK